MNEATEVVVFDFDLTLTRWDMTDVFCRWLLKRSPWRMAMMWLSAPFLAALLLFRRTRALPGRYAIWVATWGRDAASLPAWVDRYLDSLPGGGQAALLPQGLARVHEHLAAGQRVIIATGCIRPLVAALLHKAGLGKLPLVASTLRPRLGGLVHAEHCYWHNKPVMLAARGFTPPWAAVYTDHHADLPLLHQAQVGYLVSPTPETLARVQKALSSPPMVLDWR
ncbi:MAG TPA: HAD family hydrolase [Rhodanobacteraceae bacterium]